MPNNKIDTITNGSETCDILDKNSVQLEGNQEISGMKTFNGTVTINVPLVDNTNTIEKKTNKVTSVSSSSTDAQYPSAKCVYDYVDANKGTKLYKHEIYVGMEGSFNINLLLVNTRSSVYENINQLINSEIGLSNCVSMGVKNDEWTKYKSFNDLTITSDKGLVVRCSFNESDVFIYTDEEASISDLDDISDTVTPL